MNNLNTIIWLQVFQATLMFRVTTNTTITTANNNKNNNDNAIRTDDVKAKIDNKLKNNKCKSCVDRDETISHIISECKIVVPKEYKSTSGDRKYEPMGIMIKIKINPADKWYIHKPESVLENKMYKIPWGLEIQTNPKIPVRRLEIALFN